MGNFYQALVFCFLFALPAQAQESNKIEVDLDKVNQELKKQSNVIEIEPPQPDRVEKIQVTGSHIKRIDTEGPSPVMTIDQDDLVRSGYNSVSDVLRDTGVNSFGSFRETTGQVGAGTAAVDLRGLGQVRTLILLNGQRLPNDSVAGSVDLNIIPMGAVERIEILKDGASAIYGSDALGGVVNIITKKNYEGNHFASSFSVTEQPGGERRDMSYIYGYNGDRFRMTNTVFFRHNERVKSQDRSWSQVGLSTFGSPGSKSKDGGGTYQPDPNCPPELVDGIGRCRYNYGDENWEMPYVMQGSLMNEMEYDINGSLTAVTRVNYSYKEVDWVYAPAFTSGLTIDDPDNPGETLNLRYRVRELGNRASNTRTNSGMVLTGLRGELGDTWDWETNLSFNKVDRKERRSGYALTQDIQNRIDAGLYNPLAPEGERGFINDLRYDPQQNSVSENTFFEAKTSGEAWDFGIGTMSLAFGTQATRELYRDGADDRTLNGEVLSIASSAGGGARNSVSVFSEANAILWEDLEAVTALRYDHYDGFGGTVNPKLAFRYSPMKELMFRTSAGTGFKAPQMQRLFAAQTTGFQTFIDQVHCDRVGGDACNPTQLPVVIGGNQQLKEERSFSFNIGSVVQPVRNHSLAVDFWYYNLEDLVEETNYGAITRAEAAGVDISKYGAVAERNPVTGELQGVGLYAPFLNVSSTETQGLDFAYDGKVLTAAGDFRLLSRHSHMIYYKTEDFPGTGITDLVGAFGRPQWRNNTTLFYNPNKSNEFSILARTIAQNSKLRPSAGKHPTYTEYDFRYILSVASWDAQITFGVKNLLGSTPPIDDSVVTDNDLNFRLYDERGRSAYLGYRQVF